jgi:1-deoxy-D-xylulose-5-phosphate reductoisomerase
MGQKISVDSSTMMNKALEVIEAKWLFDLAPSQIKVVIHPQSIIHSMVVCTDASVLAQMGTPDMRVPIAYGLSYPQRIVSGASQLDLLKLQDLTFEAPCVQRFPGLFLAWQALESAQGTTTVLNAANEVAVAAFLEGKIPYSDIVQLNTRAIEYIQPELPSEPQLEDLLALDSRTRAKVTEWTDRSPC